MRFKFGANIFIIFIMAANVACTNVESTSETSESVIGTATSNINDETNANTDDCKGTYGTESRWFFDSSSGVLSLSNDYQDNEMIDFKVGEAPWSRYSSQIKSVEVSINYIGDNYFCDCKSLKEVYFNRELMRISDEAFNGCDNIETIITDFDNKIIKKFAVDNGYNYIVQDVNSTALDGE